MELDNRTFQLNQPVIGTPTRIPNPKVDESEFIEVPTSGSYSIEPNVAEKTDKMISVYYYIGITLLSLFLTIALFFRMPEYDRNGQKLTSSIKYGALGAGVLFFGIAAIVGGMMLKHMVSTYDSSNFVNIPVASIMTILISYITAIIIGEVSGVGFLWSASDEENKPKQTTIDDNQGVLSMG